MSSPASGAEFRRDVVVLIVDHHPLIAAAIQGALASFDWIAETRIASSPAAAISALPGVHVVLLDLHLGEEDGLALLRQLRAGHPELIVLVLSASEDPVMVRAALGAGAHGYLTRETPGLQLVEAISAALSGERPIDERLRAALATPSDSTPFTLGDLELLTLLAEGMTNVALGRRLQIAPSTVQKRIDGLYGNFGVRDRAELVAVAFRRGLLV